jgi:hypothetical protein
LLLLQLAASARGLPAAVPAPSAGVLPCPGACVRSVRYGTGFVWKPGSGRAVFATAAMVSRGLEASLSSRKLSGLTVAL